MRFKLNSYRNLHKVDNIVLPIKPVLETLQPQTSALCEFIFAAKKEGYSAICKLSSIVFTILTYHVLLYINH